VDQLKQCIGRPVGHRSIFILKANTSKSFSRSIAYFISVKKIQ
jgi:dolichol kinase